MICPFVGKYSKSETDSYVKSIVTAQGKWTWNVKESKVTRDVFFQTACIQ